MTRSEHAAKDTCLCGAAKLVRSRSCRRCHKPLLGVTGAAHPGWRTGSTARPRMTKREAAAIGSMAAQVAVQARMHARPTWRCSGCGCERVGTSKRLKQRYCSTSCMAVAYAERMRGQFNPNYRDAGRRICDHCRKEFIHYNKARRYLPENVVTMARAWHQLFDDGVFFLLDKRGRDAKQHADIDHFAWNRRWIAKGDEPFRVRRGLPVVELETVRD